MQKSQQSRCVSWSTVKIGELGAVITGKTPPTKQRQYFEGEYLFITPSDLEYDSFRVFNTATTVSEHAKSKFANQFLPKNAITFTCIASVGKIGVTTTDSLTNQQINSIIVNDKHDWRFIYYLLRCETRRIQGMSSGVAAPIINKKDFEKIEIRVPNTLQVERFIADILSAYDNLIENNRKRIALLEQSARLLYKEWFVHLRFPGHEHATITNGLPDGWRKGTIGDVSNRIKVNYTIDDEKLPLLDLSRMNSKTLSVTETGRSGDLETARIIFDKDDILFSSIRPYLHKVALAPFRGITNLSVFVIRANQACPRAYLALTLSGDYAVAYANQHTTGTKMPVVKWAAVSSLPVFIPAKTVLDRYEKIAGAMLKQIKSFYFINQRLTKARDLFLPRLLRGNFNLKNFSGGTR